MPCDGSVRTDGPGTHRERNAIGKPTCPVKPLIGEPSIAKRELCSRSPTMRSVSTFGARSRSAYTPSYPTRLAGF